MTIVNINYLHLTVITIEVLCPFDPLEQIYHLKQEGEKIETRKMF